MRTILALAFIALLAGAFAAKSKSKSKVEIQESKLISSLKGLFQLASKDELEEVADILAQVRAEIEENLAGIKENYALEEEDHEYGDAAYTEVINYIENAIEEIEVALSDAGQVVDELQEGIDAAVNAIAEAQASQDNEEARRVEADNAFRKRSDKYHNLIASAEDALKLLQEIDSQDLSGSFLEINNKKIKNNLETMHKHLKSLKRSSTLEPMLDMLIEVAAAGINHDLIAQLEDLLNAFIAGVEAEIDQAVQNDNEDAEYSAATLASLQSTIDSQTNAAKLNQDILDEINGEIAFGEWALDYLRNANESVKAEYEAFEAAWKEKSSNFKALIKRLERDIEALKAAEKFVDRD